MVYTALLHTAQVIVESSALGETEGYTASQGAAIGNWNSRLALERAANLLHMVRETGAVPTAVLQQQRLTLKPTVLADDLSRDLSRDQRDSTAVRSPLRAGAHRSERESSASSCSSSNSTVSKYSEVHRQKRSSCDLPRSRAPTAASASSTDDTVSSNSGVAVVELGTVGEALSSTGSSSDNLNLCI
jgi:hypothetical protein